MQRLNSSIKPLIEAISNHQISIDDKVADYDELLEVLNSIYRNLFCLQTINNWKMIQDKIPDEKKRDGYVVTCGNEFLMPQNVDEKENSIYEDLNNDFSELYSMLEFYQVYPENHPDKDSILINAAAMIDMMSSDIYHNNVEHIIKEQKED